VIHFRVNGDGIERAMTEQIRNRLERLTSPEQSRGESVPECMRALWRNPRRFIRELTSSEIAEGPSRRCGALARRKMKSQSLAGRSFLRYSAKDSATLSVKTCWTDLPPLCAAKSTVLSRQSMSASCSADT